MRQLDLFFRHQKADGQLPIAVLDNRIGYGQIQECVSIGGLCLDALRLCPDEEKLADWEQFKAKLKSRYGITI